MDHCKTDAGSTKQDQQTPLRIRKLFPFLTGVCCLLAAILLTGCSIAKDGDIEEVDCETSNNCEDSVGGANQTQTNNASKTWTVLGNIGVAESSENVDSTESRQWIIQLPDHWTTNKVNEYGSGAPGEVKWRGRPETGVSAIIFQGNKNELQQCLEQNSGALYAEEVITVKASGLRGGVKAERRLAQQDVDINLWGLDRLDDEVGLDGSYDNFGITGAGTHVYVLDTGIRTTHNEFEGRAIPELDMTVFPAQRCNGDRNCAFDVNGHGTHCAGTIAGKTAGVAKEAIVHAVKVLGDDGSGSNAGIIRAIDFVAAEG
jgi:hypothetical protein